MLCYNCMREKGDAQICPYCGCENTPDPATHHLPAGAVIGGRYTLGRVLGEGGFGITYIGFDHTLDILVAIKEYFPYGISHRINTVSNTVTISAGDQESYFEKGKKRFLNEAKNVARFRKESGIVTVFDFIEENNTAYIVMEYLDGVDLRNYLRQHGALTVDQTLDLLLPVIKSLDKMHAAGIIHRDISPDNLMVLNDGSVKLMDFGAARDFVGDERSMSVMLKKGYAPEEQYRSNGKQGPWTDVYGICTTIYRCITGKTPNESLDRIFEDHLKRPSELGVAISPAMENVLLYGLAVRHEDRCQTMAELYRLLNEARQQSAPFAPQPAPRPVPAQPAQTAPVPTRPLQTTAVPTTPLQVQPVQPQQHSTQPVPMQPVTQHSAAPAQQNYREGRTQAADESANPQNTPGNQATWNTAPPTGGAYPVAPVASDMPKKKRSPVVPIIIASVAAVLVIALVIFLLNNGKPDPDPTPTPTTSPTAAPTAAPTDVPEPSETVDPTAKPGSSGFKVAEDSNEGKIFQKLVDYTFGVIDADEYEYDNYDSDLFPLSDNGCYQTDKKKTYFTTGLKATDDTPYECSTDITVAKKTYTVGTTTLQELLDDGWAYADGQDPPTANKKLSQLVNLELKGQTITIFVDNTGDKPTQAPIESFFIDGPGGYDSNPAPFQYHNFVSDDDAATAYQKAPPTSIKFYSGSASGTIEYDYAASDSHIVFNLNFDYDPDTNKSSLDEIHLSYYD